MIWGMSTETFTLVHIGLSLVGIVSGFVAMGGLVGAKRLEGWTALFLLTTLATNVTGFGFPFTELLPAHKIGIVSIAVLAVALVARYGLGLAGRARAAYVLSAGAALWLNTLVLVVQTFLKNPALRALAPKQEEPPFLIAQGVTFALLAALTLSALRGSRGVDA